jgi:hypothetical protein
MLDSNTLQDPATRKTLQRTTHLVEARFGVGIKVEQQVILSSSIFNYSCCRERHARRNGDRAGKPWRAQADGYE